jgi:hypothetical protein
MEMLIMLGYVAFATLSVFSFINIIKQINRVPNEKD